uniref:Advanced glycosylation end product-specific receptor n=2 Tax=Canis lupus familiaris TaxID=9615 RepID=A0A8C0RM39_CANLF|nr:advanced glycosylation end product-specific receptor variant G [Canis lupus familiaris]
MEAGKQGSCHSSRSPQPGPSDGWWPHLSVSQVLSQRTCTVQALLCPQNTGRTEAWKVLSPQGGPWDSVARVLPNGSLLLPAVGIQDEGTFRCRATSRNGKETRSTYQVRVYQIPGKPEIINPASELMAGVPSKVGTCVSEGGYPAGTLSWHWDGKPLIPDGKGVSVQEETRRHPETGLFTLQSELMVTPAQGGAPHPTFSCSFSPGLPRRRALHAAPIQLNVWETDKEGPTTGYVEGQGLGTVALALGILGGLGIAVLLIGAIMWRRRQRQRQERKAPENQEEEEEEERTELNQSEEPEAAESGAAGP